MRGTSAHNHLLITLSFRAHLLSSASTFQLLAHRTSAMPSSDNDAATASAAPPSQPYTQSIAQGSSPTRAFGILLDQECLLRLGEAISERMCPGELSNMSPEEKRKTLLCARIATLSEIAYMVYEAFPNIPRLRRNTILMSDAAGTWLLVFKDNSSHACLHAPLDPEDVKGAKKLLGLQRQAAKWYHVFL